MYTVLVYDFSFNVKPKYIKIQFTIFILSFASFFLYTSDVLRETANVKTHLVDKHCSSKSGVLNPFNFMYPMKSFSIGHVNLTQNAASRRVKRNAWFINLVY